MNALTLEPTPPAAGERMTLEELERLPDDDNHYELRRGRLVKHLPPNADDGNVVIRLAQHMQNFLDETGFADAFVETGFILARNPDTVRGPGLSVVLRSRLESVDWSRGFFPGAPDLAVEVVSPGDTHDEVADKVAAYLAFGGAWFGWCAPRAAPLRSTGRARREGSWRVATRWTAASSCRAWCCRWRGSSGPELLSWSGQVTRRVGGGTATVEADG